MTEIGRPVITGGSSAGSVLTIVREAQFFAEHPYTITRQWLRNGVPISGATGTTYTRTTGDNGAAIRLRFTCTNANGSTPFDSNSIT